MLHRLHAYISALHGWRRNAAAFLFGVMATLALPPVFAFPLLIPAFTGLYWLVTSAPAHKRAFADGWWWGWGFHITGLYWFSIALLTDPDKFAWMIPFALFAITGILALYAGLACWLASFSASRGLVRILVFTVLWTLVEYARGHWFTGFPWNLAGYSFAFSDAALQPASFVGIYGLTWWALWLGTVPAILVTGGRRAAMAVSVSYILFISMIGWGQWRLQVAEEASVPGVMLRLVQGNIAQHHKWDPKLRMQGLQEQVRLTQSPGLERITHVVWAETAVPFVLGGDTALTRMLGAALTPGALLITGILREEDKEIWNSLVAIDHEGDIVGSYDKFKLVPFGEFVPLRRVLPAAWLTPVGPRDFASGTGPETLAWPGLPRLSPLICYEAIFPELAVSREERPEMLLNVTNDAWFGRSSGPYQHFHMARLRAVEQGLPLVRVANTGITAVLDPYGRIKARLGLGEQGVLDVELPQKRAGSTIYAQYGDRCLLLLVFAALMLIIWQRTRPKN